ncbi:hypothetical protein ACYK64_000554 [Enterococcus hirae]
MDNINIRSEDPTSTGENQLYNRLNFSEEQIKEDQQQATHEWIKGNDHIFLDDLISKHKNVFSELPNNIKIPSEKIYGIHHREPGDKLLYLHQGKLYYIENLNQFKEKGKAYVIAEDVSYRKNRLFQANKKFNIYQNLVTNAKMTKNKTNGAHTMFVHPDLVCSIIRNNEIFQEAKNSKGVDRRIAQPDQTYIGKGLKIGIPKYTSSNPKMTVQLMLYKGSLYQIDPKNKQSKFLADKVERRGVHFFKRNEQGLRVELFQGYVEKAQKNNILKKYFKNKKRNKTETIHMESHTLGKINQNLQDFETMGKKDQIAGQPWLEVNPEDFSSLKIPESPTPQNDKDLIYYDRNKRALYKLETNVHGKVKKAHLLINKHIYDLQDAKRLALKDSGKDLKLDLFAKAELSHGMMWAPKGVIEEKVAYFVEAQKTFTHENRYTDKHTLLMKDATLYLVNHRLKEAIIVADNVYYENEKLKSGSQVLVYSLPFNENMKWRIPPYVASEIREIAEIIQAKNITRSNTIVALQEHAKKEIKNHAHGVQEQDMPTRSCVSIGARPGTSR